MVKFKMSISHQRFRMLNIILLSFFSFFIKYEHAPSHSVPYTHTLALISAEAAAAAVQAKLFISFRCMRTQITNYLAWLYETRKDEPAEQE